MERVKGEYPDYLSYSQKKYFFLNSDQVFNPYTWKPPIHWEGTVDGIKVKFKQIEPGAYNKDSFDWTDFPEQLEEAKYYIVKAINTAMKTMD